MAFRKKAPPSALPDLKGMQELKDDIKTAKLNERVCLVCSVDSGGATSFVHSLTDEFLADLKNDATRRVLKKRQMVAYNPLFIPSGDASEPPLNLTFIDCGSVASPDRYRGLRKVCSSVHYVSCAFLCVKLSRWGSYVVSEIESTLNNLALVGIPRSAVVLTLTHHDCFTTSQEQVAESVAQALPFVDVAQLGGVFPGCFVRDKVLTDNGTKIYGRRKLVTFLQFQRLVTGFAEKLSFKNLIFGDAPLTPKQLERIAREDRTAGLDEDFKVDEVGPLVDPNPDSKDCERKVVMIGFTGAGKSEVISSLTGVKQKSECNVLPVTMECVRTDTISMMPANAARPFAVELVDTVGFGDINNNPDRVINQLVHYMKTKFTFVDLVIVCLRYGSNNPKILKEMDAVLGFLRRKLRLTRDNCVCLLTHCDFYKPEAINDYMRQVYEHTSNLRSLCEANMIYGCVVNTDEISPDTRRWFEIQKNNTIVTLKKQIIKPRRRIGTGELLNSLDPEEVAELFVKVADT